MKKLFFFILTISLLWSCKTKQTFTAVPDFEIRELDTLTVTAPKPDEFKSPEEYSLPNYNPSHTRINDLIHTKLEVGFNWEKEQVLGKATLTLKPYFYPTQYAVLDAKNFDFKKIQLAGGKELKYEYDGKQVIIDLGREYKKEEEYQLFIDYVASPAAEGGSAAISSDKGLFFINPRGEEGEKPQQIWTQGETENNSRWFPTVDKPNERCTQEIYLTVQDKFETLSNGILISSNKNDDGTRTDYWKMDLPHAPYLFMVAIGEFAVIREEWKGKPVEYFVEKKYEKYAKDIYPYTTEMLSFFSEKLGVEYPWQKYSQITVRDYVSGAMENTTGVIFGEFMLGTDRELIDNLTNEKIVAHEMFHHWFGDLVTCESWANLTMNEGFANYSEYLWLEHKYGKDEADYHLMSELRGYLASANNEIHPLIHFGHADKEDMFDAHSYNKGGLVLHMLRNYVGDEAFFASLNKYLTDNKYSDVEADELRLAFEDVVGEDLNWFFDQWYFEAGHPMVEVTYSYDEATKKIKVLVEQIQNPQRQPAIFQMPVAIDIYKKNGEVERQNVWLDQRVQAFEFDISEKPNLVNFDAEKILLTEKIENKTEQEYLFQYQNAPTFLDRFEALDNLKESENITVRQIFKEALNDEFYVLRALSLSVVDLTDEVIAKIAELAANDPHSQVRYTAFEKLGDTGSTKYAPIAKKAIENDPAYQVVGGALQALVTLDKAAAAEMAQKLENEDNSSILEAIGEIYVATGDSKHLPFFERSWSKMQGFGAIGFIENYAVLSASTASETILGSAQKLETIATNMGKSPWVRFAAMNGVNTLHAEMVQRIESAGNTDTSELQDIDSQIIQVIQKIKDTEENDRLKMMYGRYPTPSVKP